MVVVRKICNGEEEVVIRMTDCMHAFLTQLEPAGRPDTDRTHHDLTHAETREGGIRSCRGQRLDVASPTSWDARVCEGEMGRVPVKGAFVRCSIRPFHGG